MTVFRPAADVAWMDAASVPGIPTTEAIWLSRASDPHPVELRGWAWLIWQQLAPGGTSAEITDRVNEQQELPADGSVDVPAFLAQLEEQGFLSASRDSSGAVEHPNR